MKSAIVRPSTKRAVDPLPLIDPHPGTPEAWVFVRLAGGHAFDSRLIAGVSRTLKSDLSTRILAAGWAGAVLDFYLHGLVDSFFGSYERMGLFWTSGGALAAAADCPPAERAGMIQPADAN